MSDAMTDIARSEERRTLFMAYLLKIKEYISERGIDAFDAVLKAADKMDQNSQRYWGEKTNFGYDIVVRLNRLTGGNKSSEEKEWAKLLNQVISISGYCSLFQELKALSPFADKMILHVSYGKGFVHINGLEQLNSTISKAIEKSGMKTYDRDDYLVVMPPIEINADKIETFRLHSGITSVDGPRKPAEN